MTTHLYLPLPDFPSRLPCPALPFPALPSSPNPFVLHESSSTSSWSSHTADFLRLRRRRRSRKTKLFGGFPLASERERKYGWGRCVAVEFGKKKKKERKKK